MIFLATFGRGRALSNGGEVGVLHLGVQSGVVYGA